MQAATSDHHAPLVLTVQDIENVVHKEFWAMFVAEAAIWTPVQIVNFSLVPAQQQQLFVNLMCIVEAAVMSQCAASALAFKPALWLKGERERGGEG